MRLPWKRRRFAFSVKPHEFKPLGRIFHRDKCRFCHIPPELHPTTGYVAARAEGEKR